MAAKPQPFVPVPTQLLLLLLLLEPTGTSTVGDRHDPVPSHVDASAGHELAR
ncbi:MAG: hypothetical protein WAK82_30040 [Streptosporangiaceae bacterium]